MCAAVTPAMVSGWISNGSWSGDPSVITCSTRSGLLCDSTLASTPPRLWPTRETLAPVLRRSSRSASTSGRSITSEYMTLNVTPATRGRYPTRRSPRHHLGVNALEGAARHTWPVPDAAQPLERRVERPVAGEEAGDEHHRLSQAGRHFHTAEHGVANEGHV